MNRPGFSLVELIVAMLVLATGLAALAGAAATARRSLARAAALERITREAAALLDSLVAEQAPASGQRARDGTTMRWSVRHDDDGAWIDLEAAAFDGLADVHLRFEARNASR